MKVFIAAFERENYEWPQCLARGTVASPLTSASCDERRFYS
jgi:hypothetical protein